MTPSKSRTVYRCFNAEDALLYVGATTNSASRIASQSRDKNWWSEVVRIELEHFPSIEDATANEQWAIECERPLYNRARGHVVTEHDLAHRRRMRELERERRDQGLEERQRAQREWRDARYAAAAVCGNCRHGEGYSQLWFLKGTTVEETTCSECGAAAYERKAA